MYINKNKNSLYITLIGILFVCSAFLKPFQNPAVSEYQVKAVFIYNFTQFIDWPEDAFPHSNAPFVIGVLGEDPFDAYLEQAIRGESFRGHPMTFKRFDSPEDIKGCHILFLSTKEREHLDDLMKSFRGSSMLIVSDVRGSAKMGGMVEFVEINKKIRLRINQKAAENAKLQISSKLLRLSEVVTTEN